MTKPESVIEKVVKKLSKDDAEIVIFAIRSGHVERAYNMLSKKFGYPVPTVKIGAEYMVDQPGAAALCKNDSSGVVILFRDVKLSESFFTALHEYGHAVLVYEKIFVPPDKEEHLATVFEMAVVKLADIVGLRANY